MYSYVLNVKLIKFSDGQGIVTEREGNKKSRVL